MLGVVRMNQRIARTRARWCLAEPSEDVENSWIERRQIGDGATAVAEVLGFRCVQSGLRFFTDGPQKIASVLRLKDSVLNQIRKSSPLNKVAGSMVPLKVFVVPVERIELPTFGLQNRCSTAELNRHFAEVSAG